ncbi:MAG: two-component system sensor histidine kinase CreC [Desulfobacterales bacterium]|nr:two-component system sensor histidine kinase CreC [Desulfobacterales bacterium]MBF0398029.1 two-component system sensor histidine kinase CreC [Desulfobacterales bacterium]
MKLGTRIFCCYMLIFCICFYFSIHFFLNDLRIRYLEVVEETLIDQANILSSIISKEMELKQFDADKLYKSFENTYSRTFSAVIYKFIKTNVDVSVYITDKAGKVIFDSINKENLGAMYGKWRDVYLTLKGKYGARATLKNPLNRKSSVIYVAAPIIIKNNIEGVLTVAKPTTNIDNFLDKAKPKVIKAGLISVSAAILFGLIVSMWLTIPIKRLTQYANDIRQGKRVKFPKLDNTEIGEMGAAFEKMSEALEGKKYVENYVQNLTHEIKSPLSAIRGAAELLEEKMDIEQKSKFLSNIRNEAGRIQLIVDRMLTLASLENQKKLKKLETITIESIINMSIESKEPILSKKKINLFLKIESDIFIKGDAFLLQLAVSNLIQNAIDFSPEYSEIKILTKIDNNQVKLIIEDCGIGVPDFAIDKVFDKFFSLQRPETKKKSTGLGLNFVKEIAVLHGGDVEIENKEDAGVRATLTLFYKHLGGGNK